MFPYWIYHQLLFEFLCAQDDVYSLIPFCSNYHFPEAESFWLDQLDPFLFHKFHICKIYLLFSLFLPSGFFSCIPTPFHPLPWSQLTGRQVPPGPSWRKPHFFALSLSCSSSLWQWNLHCLLIKLGVSHVQLQWNLILIFILKNRIQLDISAISQIWLPFLRYKHYATLSCWSYKGDLSRNVSVCGDITLQ